MESETPEVKGRWWWLPVLVLAALVLCASSISLWKNFHQLEIFQRAPKHSRVMIDKYANALSLSVQFFDVQKAGKLVNNNISWRGDSALGDGKEENLDLTKGMYDAGDLMKFGFPMAFTATILSWAILEYGDHMKQAKELDHIQDSLKWIVDYLINAHPSGNVLYVQVPTYLLYFKIELIDALINELPVVDKYLKFFDVLIRNIKIVSQ